MLVIYSMPEGTKCPPKVEDDLGGMVKVGDPWGQYEHGNATVYQVQVPDNSTVYVWAKNSVRPGKCTWVPVEGQHLTQVGSTTATFCVSYRCMEAGNLVSPLTGMYSAKRKDQSESFQVEMTFRQNSQFCLLCEIRAPRKLDQAQAFLHTKPERGNHGTPHPGDFMVKNNPLTEGFLQGTFVGPDGEAGTLRMVLGLVPAAQGMFHVHFGGFLSFGGSDNIETVFTSVNPIRWPAMGVPV